ncbi:MAG: bifunctional demethylmenaquinone methyltransferase/2-methoxy-6-polyprenyl-1,4-benzoquinol methylase UbiE [Candidatus Wildermuthbacteria bacterium]|nr:bifunctional demethylmenaquinone methyltransferase/2-methoxy-6-polyprenyl-1,4-benzoquinol methylase UbiE [Candidatus Wildermuthbacteria bacterium]
MKESTEEMFSRIVGRYDFLNHVMSGGLDIAWRKKLVSVAEPKGGDFVADIATGTGDVAFEFAKKGDGIRVVGVDISEEMLKIAREKAKRKGFEQVTFRHGDALQLLLEDNTFDIVTMTFGIRNLPDYEKGLKEMIRVAKKGGKILILEFSMPMNFFARFLYRLYLKVVVPFFGSVFSERSAYEYLNKSIEEFATVDVVQVMRSAGLQRVQRVPLSFGIVSLYAATK